MEQEAAAVADDASDASKVKGPPLPPFLPLNAMRKFFFGDKPAITLGDKINLFERLAKCDTQAWTNMAKQLLHEKDPLMAKNIFVILLEKLPNDLQSMLLLVKSNIALGPSSFQSSMKAIRGAYEIRKGTPQSSDLFKAEWALVVSLAMQTRDRNLTVATRADIRRECLQLLEKTGQYKQLKTATYTRGLILADAGQVEEATEAVKGLFSSKVDPLLFTQKANESSQEKRPPLLQLLALLLTSRQQYREALDMISLCGRTGPADKLSRIELVTMMIEARIHAAMDDGLRAAEVLGGIVARLRLAATAEKNVRKKAEFNEWQGEVLLELVSVLVSGNCHDAATAALAAAGAVLPQRSAAWLTAAGSAALAAGHVDSAIEKLNESLALDPSNSRTLAGLGSAYHHRGKASGANVSNLSLAHDFLSEALFREPENSATWYELGMVCSALGQKEEAEEVLRKATLVSRSAPALPYSDLPLTPIINELIGS